MKPEYPLKKSYYNFDCVLCVSNLKVFDDIIITLTFTLLYVCVLLYYVNIAIQVLLRRSTCAIIFLMSCT